MIFYSSLSPRPTCYELRAASFEQDSRSLQLLSHNFIVKKILTTYGPLRALDGEL